MVIIEGGSFMVEASKGIKSNLVYEIIGAHHSEPMF